MSIIVDIIPILGDHKNYAYLLHTKCGHTAIVDPGESAPIIDVCVEKDIHIDYIMTTHHHWDHTDGNAELIEKYGCNAIGPDAERESINHLNIRVKNNDSVKIGSQTARIISLPGHTKGHIAFYFPEPKMLFCGDVLFGGGCGRIFEGTFEQMWKSLNTIMSLPDDTYIYFGHEYTLSNLEFGLKIEPSNIDIKKRIEKIRTGHIPTAPTTLDLEKKTNVFLRARTLDRFTYLRALKDNS